MLDGYIIEKLKREKEQREQEQWQPVPLPLEEYNPCERQKPEKKPENRGVVVLELFASAMATSNEFLHC